MSRPVRPDPFALLVEERQVRFYAENLEIALATGERIAKSFGQHGFNVLASGEVESAVTEALAKVAVRSTESSFDASRGIGLLKVYIFNAVRTVVSRERRRTKGHPVVLPGGAKRVIDVPAPTDEDENEQTEQLARQDETLQRVLALTGGVVPQSHADWVNVGLALGMSRLAVYTSTKEELLRLVANIIRERLTGDGEHPSESAAVADEEQLPPRIINRLRKPEPDADPEEDGPWFRFVRVWVASPSTEVVAATLGWSRVSIKRSAWWLRSRGVRLPYLRDERRPRRRAIDVLPSVN